MTSRSSSSGRPSSARRALRRVLVVDAVEAVAPQARARATRAGRRRSRAAGGQRGVERGVEHRHLRQRRRAAPRAAATPSRAARRCAAAPSSDERPHLRRSTVVVDQRRRVEARAAVDDPVADRVDVGRQLAEQRRARRPPSPGRGRPRRPHDVAGRRERRARLDLVERGLERARAGVDARAPSPSRRPGPVAHLGHVLAVLARVLLVLAGACRASRWRSVRPRACPSRGTRSITSHDEVEAVEVVEHAPCRTASWSCPPPCSRARGGCAWLVRR